MTVTPPSSVTVTRLWLTTVFFPSLPVTDTTLPWVFAPASISALSRGTVELPITLTSDIFPEPRTTTLAEPSSMSTE